MGKSFSRGANIMDDESDEEQSQEGSSQEEYGEEDQNPDEEDDEEDEGSEFRARLDSSNVASSRAKEISKSKTPTAPPNPNARVTRSAARKNSG